jgi:phosphatidylglycerophosphate synthase
MWENIVNQMLPILIIIIFSIALILRVLLQKHRLHQPIQWRKHRKMTIQLLSISILYLIFSFPNTFMIFIDFCGLSYDKDSDVKQYAAFLSYLVILFFPFVCILSLPELQNKIRKILPLRRRRARAIGPEILILRNNQNALVLKNNVQ